MTVSGTPSSPPSTPMAALLPGLYAGGGATESTSIKVFCRLRQQNQLEKREGASECSTVVDQRTIFLRNERCDVDEIRCTFDRVFDVHATQQEVYEYTAKPLVSDFLQGYNCTIFAYGQTGSGKTHTILGPKDGVLVKSEEEGGIISRVIKDIFKEVEKSKSTDATPPEAAPVVMTAAKGGVTATATATGAAPASGETVEFTVSFVEIYMEQIRDLLAAGGGSTVAATGGLKIRENAQKGIFIEDMTQVHAPTEHATMELVKTGTLNRAVSSTRMNKDSSRSHSILIITCTRKALKGAILKRSTMYIVDLAGSEFVNKTNAAGKVLQEAKAINKSLSALSNVIKALVEGKKHVPYRDSKLTRILQDSLGGSAKTCLILAASCSSYNMPETISTLRFGLRAKEIKNPVVQRQESAPGIGPGGIFKELYQQAMEELEEKNKKIDELQQLLSAVYQENQQLAETEQQQQHLLDEVPVEDAPQGGDEYRLEQQEPSWPNAINESRGARDTDGLKGEGNTVASQAVDENADNDCADSSSDGDDNEDGSEDDDDGKALELALREKEELAQRTTTLTEENKRLFHVLEALESQLDQVAVDLSSGRPVLSLRASEALLSLPSKQQQQQEEEESSHDMPPPANELDQHLLSLKIWLQSDKWQQALEREPIEANADASTALAEPSLSPQRGVTVHPLSAGDAQHFSPLKHQLASLTLSMVAHDTADDQVSAAASPLHLLPCASNTDTTPCVHRIDAEALSRQIVELKLQLHYLSESTKQALDGESHLIVLENAKLKTRIEELEFQASLCTVACNQLEMKNRACETRLSNQETHIGCLQNSLQEYQGLFKQQIIMSQEKCRLLTDELEFYKKLAKCSQPSSLMHLGGASTSPPKASPSPRKHRINVCAVGGNSSNSPFASLATVSSSQAPSKPNPVSTMLFPELEHEMSTATSANGTEGNPFGLWRSFGSLYKPSASKTAPNGEVEIELAGKPSASTASVSPLSIKMSRPIVKPIGAPVAPVSATIAATVEQTRGSEDMSFSPWIVRGFGGASSDGSSSIRTPLTHSRPDATLDELAGPIEMAE